MLQRARGASTCASPRSVEAVYEFPTLTDFGIRRALEQPSRSNWSCEVGSLIVMAACAVYPCAVAAKRAAFVTAFGHARELAMIIRRRWLPLA